MIAASSVLAFLRDSDGRDVGTLRITVLPKKGELARDALWEPELVVESDQPDACIQVLEGHEYHYEWIGLPEGLASVASDPEEIFQPDTIEGLAGRLRPALSTGFVQVSLRSGTSVLGRLELEVRSRKLNYASEYRWMLRDIAEHMTELVMDRFAASGTRFELDESRDAVTLYQRFAFLQALLESESFELAIGEILRRPHTAWETNVEPVRPGSGLRADSHTVRQLAKAGLRVAWPGGPINSVPFQLERRRTEATHDTTPNRFVKFALERWRQVVSDIERCLAATASTPATGRGLREIAGVLARLDNLLSHDLFRELDSLSRFPADDQSLQRRDGYRDVFRAYVEFELAARISWQHPAEGYEAGQRDIATLYEYWAFIQIASGVAKLLGQSFDMTPLLQVRHDGLNVSLRSGVETVLSGTVERLGRRLTVELWFNRTYGNSKAVVGSWTRPMRPDYSLLIRSLDDEPAGFEPVIIHFDAKYRVNFVSELFGPTPEGDGDDSPVEMPNLGERRGGVLRDDLLKMHAYRDAIRRTAGAYVLYPGGDEELDRRPYTEFHELLPGLGAFVLRPTATGGASGELPLRRFIDDVIDHVATRLTHHERGRFWAEEVYGGPLSLASNVLNGAKPPEETRVVLGFVKSRAHWSWIERQKLYNVRTEARAGGVRADSPLWQSQLLLLYCPESDQIALARIISEPLRISLGAMKSMAYPEPQSDYWCVQLGRLRRHDSLTGLRAAQVDEYLRNMGCLKGEPVVLSISELESIGLLGAPA